jgi:hypothetical protein
VRKHKALDLIKEFSEKERKILRQEILAPYFPNVSVICARIEGLVYPFKIDPQDRVGFGIFKPSDFVKAKYIRDAEDELVAKYLNSLPRVRAILVFQTDFWFASPADEQSCGKVGFMDLRPCHLAREASQFDYVLGAYDGYNLWYLEHDPKADIEKIERLRESLRLKNLGAKGMISEDLKAYQWALKKRKEQELLTIEARIRYQMELLDAELISYRDLGDRLHITWSKLGRQHTTVIKKEDFSVLSAGICLSGEDAQFDLVSMVGVMQEYEGSYYRR